jgi:hypothetical protein
VFIRIVSQKGKDAPECTGHAKGSDIPDKGHLLVPATGSPPTQEHPAH